MKWESWECQNFFIFIYNVKCGKYTSNREEGETKQGHRSVLNQQKITFKFFEMESSATRTRREGLVMMKMRVNFLVNMSALYFEDPKK